MTRSLIRRLSRALDPMGPLGLSVGALLLTTIEMLATPTETALAAQPTTRRSAAEWFQRGRQRHAQGNLPGAFSAYTWALRLDAAYVPAYCYRADVCYALGDLRGALADYTAALQRDPRSLPAYANRGGTREALGDLPGALLDYTQALALDPSFRPGYLRRGHLRRLLGDLDGAAEDFAAAQQLAQS